MDLLRTILFEMADEKYKKFVSKLLPETKNIIGIPLPYLRKKAREIASNNYEVYFQNAPCFYFEETMLYGMVIGAIKNCALEKRLFYVKNFIPKINNWSVCDSFCCGLKFTKNHLDEVFIFIKPYLKSRKTFEVRFAAVMLLNFYITESYLKTVLTELSTAEHEAYYAQMGVAWAVSKCYIKFPAPTFAFLKKNLLHKNIHKKALQKIMESKQISQQNKIKVKNYSRYKTKN